MNSMSTLDMISIGFIFAIGFWFGTAILSFCLFLAGVFAVAFFAALLGG